MKVPFSIAIGHGELTHECFPEHSRMGTARTKQDKATDEYGKKRDVSMERSKAGTNKGSPDDLSHPNQNTIIMNKIWSHFIRNGKSTMKLNREKKWT